MLEFQNVTSVLASTDAQKSSANKSAALIVNVSLITKALMGPI